MDSETAIASPELTGGAGFTFEDRVAAIYLTALIGNSGAPGLRADRVAAVELQRGGFGQPLDDLIVSAALQDGSSARLGLQVKRSLTISAAESNTDFRDVVGEGMGDGKGRRIPPRVRPRRRRGRVVSPMHLSAPLRPSANGRVSA